jgi:hypothetical protein
MLEKLLESNNELLNSIERRGLPPELGLSTVLFNSKEFIELSKNKKTVSYSQEGLHGKYIFNVSFDIDGTEAISLKGCPYAGLDIHGQYDQNEIKKFLIRSIKDLKSIGVRKVTIKNPPSFLQEDCVENILIECGFFISSEEINHHLELNIEDYYSSIHEMQRRKIAKCIQSKFKFQIEPSYKVGEIYKFIQSCRTQQGLEINVSLNYLKGAFSLLASNYNLFTIRNKENKILAATVIVMINESVVYNFLPAFDRNYKAHSPLAFLTYELYNYFSRKEFSYMDLGISSINGTPQEGLIKFKERMGATMTKRKNYSLTIG